MAKQLNYSRRGFGEIRAELFDFLKQYYPDTLSDFSDATIGSALVELAAGVGDILGFQTDRNAQETQREFAQQRKSLLSIARTNNVKIPGKKAAVTVVNFTVNVPPKGDSWDPDYCPRIRAGAQVLGGSKVFETIEDMDFSDANSSSGLPNRSVKIMKNQAGAVDYYVITKQEVVYNGVTKIYRQLLTPTDAQPFRKVKLPDQDVLSITSAVVLAGYPDGNPTDEQFEDDNLRFHEVDALVQPYIFGDNTLADASQTLRTGLWKKVSKKFITEFTDKGYCEMTFGAGQESVTSFNETIANSEINGTYLGLESYLLTTALGQQLPGTGTLYVKYRVGGGADTNLGAGVLTQMGNRQIAVNGTIAENVRKVIGSLTVTNPFPAFGGKDGFSIEEIRYLIAYNNAAQNRCVTLSDYYSRVMLMPGRYGAPFRVSAHKDNNKVIISILGLNPDGTLSNSSMDLLKENIAEYLSAYRMVNDYVEIRDGRIFNLGYEIKVLIEPSAQSGQIISNVALAIADFHNINARQMNEDIPLGPLQEAINSIPGVTNITTLRIYNKTTIGYSPNQVEMDILDTDSGLLDTSDNYLYGSRDAMFEVRNPLRDIVITVDRPQNKSNRF
jgi:hypothetical protein